MILRSMVATVMVAALAALAVAQQTETPSAPSSPGAVRTPGAADSPGAVRTPGATDSPGAAQPADAADAAGAARSQRGAAAGRGNWPLDQRIVQLLIAGNQGEIALAQFAQERASSQAVKDFAQMMVREHGGMVEQLQQIEFRSQGGQGSEAGARGSEAGVRSPDAQTERPAADAPRSEAGEQGTEAEGRAATQRRSATEQQGAEGTATATREDASAQRQTAAERRGGTEMRQDRLVSIIKEAGQRCVALTQQELGQKQGAEFDKCYMGQQVVMHTDMLAKLQTFEQHASGELQQLIREAIQTTEKHLQHARTIAQQLETQSAASARRPGETRE